MLIHHICIHALDQLCPTEMPYWAKNYVTMSIRDAHRMPDCVPRYFQQSLPTPPATIPYCPTRKLLVWLYDFLFRLSRKACPRICLARIWWCLVGRMSQ